MTRCFLLAALSICVTAGFGENLALNPDFARDDFGKIRAWSDGPTAELTVSDWASETEPGAPVGRTRLVNYFMVRPYYLESEAQRADIEEYLSKGK